MIYLKQLNVYQFWQHLFEVTIFQIKQDIEMKSWNIHVLVQGIQNR